MQLLAWAYGFKEIGANYDLSGAMGIMRRGTVVAPVATNIRSLRLLVRGEADTGTCYTWVSLDQLDPDTLPPELKDSFSANYVIAWQQWLDQHNQ